MVVQHIAAQNNTHAAEGCRGLRVKHICQENGHTKLGSHSPSERKVRIEKHMKGKMLTVGISYRDDQKLPRGNQDT